MLKFLEYTPIGQMIKNALGFNFTGAEIAIPLGIAAMAGGGSWLASMFGNQDESEGPEFAMPPDPKFIEEPRYAETDAAREGLFGKFEEWGKQPGYGGIAPNWDDIWKQASKRVSDYWRGTATTPGAMSRIKSSVAQRGMQDSPAFGALSARAGAEESAQLKDLATTQATKRAEFGERGRLNWQDLGKYFTNLKVPGTWNQAVPYQPEQKTSMGDVVSGVGSGVAGLAMNYYQNQWLEGQQKDQQNFLLDLIGDNNLYGKTTQGSLTGGGGMFDFANRGMGGF